MKKMNLSFLGLKAKIMFPLFLLMGLFMISATSVNAQFVSSVEAQKILDPYLTQLPEEIHTFSRVNHALTPKMVDEKVNELRHMFGRSIMFKLDTKDVGEAIKTTYDNAKNRIPAGMTELVDHLDAIKDEYVELLTAN